MNKELINMFGEGGKEFYEEGECQNCGEPLNNAEGELCPKCKQLYD